MPTAYITAPTGDARRLARLLVEERLAACVNRIPCHSTYRWADELQDDEEVILLAKTTETAYDALVQRVTDEHPYEVPCIERFDERAVPENFETWRNREVREQS